jgi:hypothetical protein
LIAIVTAPLCASVRADVTTGEPLDGAGPEPAGTEPDPEPEHVQGPVCAATCWTKGSLEANVEKPASWPFE